MSRLKAVSPNLYAHAKDELQAGHKERASLYMTKKKLVDAEVRTTMMIVRMIVGWRRGEGGGKGRGRIRSLGEEGEE